MSFDAGGWAGTGGRGGRLCDVFCGLGRRKLDWMRVGALGRGLARGLGIGGGGGVLLPQDGGGWFTLGVWMRIGWGVGIWVREGRACDWKAFGRLGWCISSAVTVRNRWARMGGWMFPLMGGWSWEIRTFGQAAAGSGNQLTPADVTSDI